MVSALCFKWDFKNSIFCQKLENLCISDHTIWFIFRQQVIVSNNIWRDLLAFLGQNLQRQHGRLSIENLLQKLIFRSSIWWTITDADLWSRMSLYTLFGMCSDHMLVKFEQNRMVQNKSWAFWQKLLIIFWESVDAISVK